MNTHKLMILVALVLTVSTAVLPADDGDRCGCSASHSQQHPRPNHR